MLDLDEMILNKRLATRKRCDRVLLRLPVSSCVDDDPVVVLFSPVDVVVVVAVCC